MKILEPKWWFSKLPCLRWTVVNIKVRDKKYNFSHTKFYRGKICAMYNCSRSVEIHSFLSYLSGSGDVMFESEYISHGSLVLVSRQMLPNSRTRTCSISKFPPYNLKKKKKKSKHLNCPVPQRSVYVFFFFFLSGEIYEKDKVEYKTRDKIFTQMSSKIKWNVMQVSKSWELLKRQECHASLAIRVKITKWYANLHWLWEWSSTLAVH